MNKNLVLTGSLAFDSIFDINGLFSNYIMPDKIHQINISVVAHNYKKTYGGTAGTQAFYFARLGIRPYIFATAGNDFTDYELFLKENKLSTEYIKILKNLHTAVGSVMTDKHDNQIWMFSPGAMSKANKLDLKEFLKLKQKPIVMISPNDKTAMINYVEQCVKYKIDFYFDPSSYAPTLPLDTLAKGVEFSQIVFGNDYEIAFMEKRLRKNYTINNSKNKIIIKTLADKGSEIYHGNNKYNIDIYKCKTVDPTGAGDAYRAGFLYGFLNNQPLKTCGLMGAATASFAVEVKGTMNLKFNKKEFEKRVRKLT